MIDKSHIVAAAEVVGADGVHLGTVAQIEGERIKLDKADSPQFAGRGGRYHWIPLGLVAATAPGQVRLSANADVAFDIFEEAE
jgi:hypothetical protein